MTFDARPLQTALAAQTPPYDPGPIDGVFGIKTRAAMQAFETVNDLPVTDFPVAAVFIGLGIPLPPDMPEPRPAPKPKFTIPGISEIGNIITIFNQAKELQMNTANVDVISAWLSSKNWAMIIAILTNIAALFHIVIPPDLAPTITTVVTSLTALYVLVKNTWFTTSVTAASAKLAGK